MERAATPEGRSDSPCPQAGNWAACPGKTNEPNRPGNTPDVQRMPAERIDRRPWAGLRNPGWDASLLRLGALARFHPAQELCAGRRLRWLKAIVASRMGSGVGAIADAGSMKRSWVDMPSVFRKLFQNTSPCEMLKSP